MEKLICLVLFALVALSGCGELPRGAAVEREILESPDEQNNRFSHYQVTRAFLPVFRGWPSTGGRAHAWISASPSRQPTTIAAGDRLRITVWDSAEDSLLTSSAPSAQIGDMRVEPNGTIFVPYAGEIRVAGLTQSAAREALQREIDSVAPQAQVQLDVTAGRLNSVDLVGGVTQPGRFTMPDRDYSVLNLIADAGGIRPGLLNPQVRLIRGDRIYGASVARLFAEPDLDTRMRGGDRVIVEEERRYFTSLGAAGEQNLHRFPQERVTAIDAVAMLGGVESRRGNPGGILILRVYPPASVRENAAGPAHRNVVFSVDLTSADGLFSAQQFQVEPGDLVLVTESPVTGLRTIMELIGSGFGLINRAGAIAG